LAPSEAGCQTGSRIRRPTRAGTFPPRRTQGWIVRKLPLLSSFRYCKQRQAVSDWPADSLSGERQMGRPRTRLAHRSDHNPRLHTHDHQLCLVSSCAFCCRPDTWSGSLRCESTDCFGLMSAGRNSWVAPPKRITGLPFTGSGPALYASVTGITEPSAHFLYSYSFARIDGFVGFQLASNFCNQRRFCLCFARCPAASR
jgi:hypothetical protein